METAGNGELAALLRAGDISAIRRSGVLHGFCSASWRRLLWLLSCDLALSAIPTSLDATPSPNAQIALDVPRAMHFDCTHSWDPAARDSALRRLSDLLNAVFAPTTGARDVDGGTPHYYQGIHDIGSVLLLEVGPVVSQRVLRHLLQRHLRGLVRPTMSPAIAVLQLLLPLVATADRDVHAALERHLSLAGMDTPHFALSWIVTLFAHNVESISSLNRLFDAFICSHPLFPLYVSAALLVHCRATVLVLEADYGPAHAALQVLPRALDRAEVAETVILRAAGLFERVQPDALVALGPVQGRDVLLQQWPEAACGTGTAWGAPVPWAPLSMETITRIAILAASVTVIGLAIWKARSK